MNSCPRCGEDYADGQEYCLECGLRLPGPGPVGPVDDPGRGWARRTLVGLAVALAGAAVAVAATGGTLGSGDRAALITATGGFATTPTGTAPVAPAGHSGILDWPTGQNGWTIALASLPQTGGKRAATTRAREARKAGLSTVGVLDSSRYASLHAGYWVVFTGVYTSEAEATSALQPARSFSRTAAVRRIVQ